MERRKELVRRRLERTWPHQADKRQTIDDRYREIRQKFEEMIKQEEWRLKQRLKEVFELEQNAQKIGQLIESDLEEKTNGSTVTTDTKRKRRRFKADAKSPFDIILADKTTPTLPEEQEDNINDEDPIGKESLPIYHGSSLYNGNAFSGSSDLELELENETNIANQETSSDIFHTDSSGERSELTREDAYSGNDIEDDGYVNTATTDFEEEKFFDAEEIGMPTLFHEDSIDELTQNDEEDLEYVSASEGEDEESEPDGSFSFVETEKGCDRPSSGCGKDFPSEWNKRSENNRIKREDLISEEIGGQTDVFRFDENPANYDSESINDAPHCLLNYDIKCRKGVKLKGDLSSKKFQKGNQPRTTQCNASILSPREDLRNSLNLQTKCSTSEISPVQIRTTNDKRFWNFAKPDNLTENGNSCSDKPDALTKDLMKPYSSAFQALATKPVQHRFHVIVHLNHIQCNFIRGSIQNIDAKNDYRNSRILIELHGLSTENIGSLVSKFDEASCRLLIEYLEKLCTGQHTGLLFTARRNTIADYTVPYGDKCLAEIPFVRKSQIVVYQIPFFDRLHLCDGQAQEGFHMDEADQIISVHNLICTTEGEKEATVQVFNTITVNEENGNVTTLLLKPSMECATRWPRLTVYPHSPEIVSQTGVTKDEYKRFATETLSPTTQMSDMMEILAEQLECRSGTKFNVGLLFSDEESYLTKMKLVLSDASKLQTSPSPKHMSIAKNQKSDGECPGKVCYPEQTGERAEETMTGRKRDTVTSNRYRIGISMNNHINDVDRDTRAPIMRTSLQIEGQVVYESFLWTPESVVNRHVNSSNEENAQSQALFFPKGGQQIDEDTTYNLQLVCLISNDTTYGRQDPIIVVELTGFSTEKIRSLVSIFDEASHRTFLQQQLIEYLEKLCTFQKTELLMTTRQHEIADDRVPYENVCLAEISVRGFVHKIQILVYQEIWDGQTSASENDSMSSCIQLDNRFNNHKKHDIKNQASTRILDGSQERPHMDEADQRMSAHDLICTIRDGKESTMVPCALTVKEEISISVETYINVSTLLLKPPMEDATKWSRLTIHPRGFDVISQGRATRDKNKHCVEERTMSSTTQMRDMMRKQPEYTIEAKLSDHVLFCGGESQFTVKSVLSSMNKPQTDRTHLPKVKNQTRGGECHRKVCHQPEPTEERAEDQMKVLKRHASNSNRYGIENSRNILKNVDKNARAPIMRKSAHIGDHPVREYFLLAPESVENRHGNSSNEENSLSPTCFLQKEFKEIYKDAAFNSQLVCHMSCEAKHSDTCWERQQGDFFSGDKSFDAPISEFGPEDIVSAKEMSERSLSYKLPGHNLKPRKRTCNPQKTTNQRQGIRVRMNDKPQQALATSHRCQQLVITGDTSVKSDIQLGDNNELLISDTVKLGTDELFKDSSSADKWADDSSGLVLFHEDFKSKPPDTACFKKSRQMISLCSTTPSDKDCVQMIYPVWDKRLGSLLYLLRLTMSHRGIFVTEWTEKIASPDQKTQPDLAIKDNTVHLNLRGRIMKGRPPRLYLQLGCNNRFGLNKRFIKNMTERRLFIPYDHYIGYKPTSYPFIQMTQSLGLYNLVGHRGYKQFLKFNIKFGEQIMKTLYKIAFEKAASGYTCSSQANNKKTCRSFKGFDSIADGSNLSVQSYYDRICNDIEPVSLSGDSCGNYSIPFADANRYIKVEKNQALTMNSDATYCNVSSYCNGADPSLETLVSPHRLHRRSAWEDTLVSQDGVDLEFEKLDTFLGKCVSCDGWSPSRDTHKTGDTIKSSYIERQASAIYSEILERSTKEITKTLQESESFAELLAFLGAQICHVCDSGPFFLCSDNLLEVIEKLKDTEQYIHELLFVILEGKELADDISINDPISFIPEFELWNES